MSDESETKLGVDGGAFDESLPKGRGSGLISVISSGVSFISDHGEIHLPLEELEISLGGASDRIVFFKHPARPETALHTADHYILQHPLIQGNPRLAELVAGIARKKRFNISILLGIFGVIIGFFLILIIARKPLAQAAVDRMPVEWETQIGYLVFSNIEKEQKVLDSPELIEELKLLTGPLLEGIDDAKYPFTFHIVENETVNAFAIPGGHVVLHSGLLLNAESPEEIAGVLAHEIAHVTRRHSMKNMVNALGTYMIIQVLLGDVSGIAGAVANNASFLIGRAHSRDFERDADNVGWEYLMKARIHPKGMVSFFEKLQEEHEAISHVEETLSFMSTHPATSERIDYLEDRLALIPSNESFREIELNLESFQNRLRSIIGENTQHQIIKR